MPRPALTVALTLCALLPAAANGQPAATNRPPALEVAVGTWLPAPGIRLSADSDGIAGSEVDLQRDLALGRRAQWDLRLTLTPARRHQFVAETFPLNGQSSTSLPRPLRFVGANYRAGDRIESTLTWNTWRGGYRYAVLQRKALSLGVNLDLWYSDLRLRLQSATADRTGRSRLPIPGLGTSVRYQATTRVWLMGEGSLFVIPDNPDHHFGGRYVNLSGAIAARVAGPLAVQAGLRWIDIRHLGAANTGFGRLAGVNLSAVLQR